MTSKKKEIVIEDYINLVKAIASKYTHFGVSFEDLLQEGMIGLLEARERYDETRETAFSTYATFWVKKRMLESVSKENQESSQMVSYNDALDSGIYQEEEIEDEHESSDIVIPDDFPVNERAVLSMHYNLKKTLNEIADKLNISREKVRQLKQKGLRRLRLFKKPK